MFVSDQCVLPVGLAATRARLVNLVRDGHLSGPSQTAYRDGLGHLHWAGPFGNSPGLPHLVTVQFLPPVDRAGAVVTGMRWQATGVTGRLFPALDANITLTAEAGRATRVTLTGVYRPPFGPLGAGLDRALLHKAATATIHSLLTRLSQALDGAAPPPGHTAAPRTWDWETGPETAT